MKHFCSQTASDGPGSETSRTWSIRVSLRFTMRPQHAAVKLRRVLKAQEVSGQHLESVCHCAIPRTSAHSWRWCLSRTDTAQRHGGVIYRGRVDALPAVCGPDVSPPLTWRPMIWNSFTRLTPKIHKCERWWVFLNFYFTSKDEITQHINIFYCFIWLI